MGRAIDTGVNLFLHVVMFLAGVVTIVCGFGTTPLWAIPTFFVCIGTGILIRKRSDHGG